MNKLNQPSYFICGGSTILDNHYPRSVWICPMYGTDDMKEYIREDLVNKSDEHPKTESGDK